MGAPLSVFGAEPAGLTPFKDSMGGGDDFRLAEHVGAGIIVTVHGPKEVSTSYGVKTAIACAVVVLDGKGGGVEYGDALIFNAAPVDQLKGLAGQTTVAKVGTYDTKQGGKAPKLEAPSAELVAEAEAFLKASA